MRTEYDDIIRAWLDGAEVEQMHKGDTRGDWEPFDGAWCIYQGTHWHYRLAKPAKKPKYLYVYLDHRVGKAEFVHHKWDIYEREYSYLGKIRLEK